MKTDDRLDSPIAAMCREKGMKLTGQRRTIAHVLSESDDHPDVEELYRRATAVDPHISIATVYRTVRLFEEKGILRRRDFGGGRARYETTDHGDHFHLIDVDTGTVMEFDDDELKALLAEIAARMGYEVATTRLELYGRRKKKKGR
ncbi:transcriptional repressor [Gluconacetobacter sp. 1b LMG 1731]|uniref:Ferric uptake regulation protein n=2 Tax=Gluconacetobacter TaxID=89583 RepID=A0A7W4JX78_9PROT|nr:MULTISPECIES: Fur family transcriptional regulator [Gluconacetobacter]MBB2164757.1 transcriptional repressor [Gluconacetobacter dulcium]MBB2187074.1 transcriptional repressor [Gluconacetobacter liquefaciens]MBB2193893.1 transcriptional repressor [Gluconacetobacter dulcium]MBB2196364.1 transcriptional repressor [Gluconacetobacter dulcium]RDI37050.1 Fur family ferric uptake transcriptional regulator [Gluconacetobacter liquefaciens]